MSSPRVYGFCDAGCRRRVPTYDEFEKSASFIEVSGNVVEIDKKYLVYGNAGFNRFVKEQYVDENALLVIYHADSYQVHQIGVLYGKDFDKYKTNHTLEVLEIVYSSTALTFIIDVDGVRKEVVVNNSTAVSLYQANNLVLKLNNLDRFYVHNDDAYIVAKGADGESAYEVAKATGFDGTEEEWLASLRGATGPQGKSAYQVAVDGGFKGTEEDWLRSLKAASMVGEHHITISRDGMLDGGVSFKADLLLYFTEPNYSVTNNLSVIGDCLKYARIEYLYLQDSPEYRRIPSHMEYANNGDVYIYYYDITSTGAVSQGMVTIAPLDIIVIDDVKEIRYYDGI